MSGLLGALNTGANLLNKGTEIANMTKTNLQNAQNMANNATGNFDSIVRQNLPTVPTVPNLAGGISNVIPGDSSASDIISGARGIGKKFSRINEKCTTNAYGNLILNKESTHNIIKKNVENFMRQIFDKDSNIIDKSEITQFTKDLIFSQVKRSIWEDNHVKHLLVYTMITNDVYFQKLGEILENAFIGQSDAKSIFEKFMQNLKIYIENPSDTYQTPPVTPLVSSQTLVKGGNSEQDAQIAEKIASWYAPDADEDIINSKILYIIKNSIKDSLNTKEARKLIYTTITKVFEEQIKNIANSSDINDVQLKCYILYKLLSDDSELVKSFTSAISQVLNNPRKPITRDLIKQEFFEFFRQTFRLKIMEKKGGKLRIRHKTNKSKTKRTKRRTHKRTHKNRSIKK